MTTPIVQAPPWLFQRRWESVVGKIQRLQSPMVIPRRRESVVTGIQRLQLAEERSPLRPGNRHQTFGVKIVVVAMQTAVELYAGEIGA